jgi:hypothetical protein
MFTRAQNKTEDPRGQRVLVQGAPPPATAWEALLSCAPPSERASARAVQVGDRVECNCGQWSQGSITKLFFTQSSFPPYECAPDQIKLDDGRLVFAPVDEDRAIRRVGMGPLPRATLAGLPGPEAWRLSESELWLPTEVIFQIVESS